MIYDRDSISCEYTLALHIAEGGENCLPPPADRGHSCEGFDLVGLVGFPCAFSIILVGFNWFN